MIKLILSFVIFAHADLSAQNPPKQLYIIGGSGDPSSQLDTIFDPAFKTVLGFLQNSNWQASVRYDGGHPTTDKMLKASETLIKDQGSLTEDSFNKTLDQMKRQAQSLTSGAQMMIFINTHGEAKTENSNIKTHGISVLKNKSDLKSSGADKLVDLDGLKDIIETANRRGIKIAVVDMSCHSGNTQTLANDKTCVISGTAANLKMHTKFSENFVKNMKTGENLESVYLSARRETPQATLPMISTAAGKTLSVQEQSLTGFLTYQDVYDSKNDNLTPLVVEESLTCKSHESPLNRLQTLKKNLAVAFKDIPHGDQDPDLLAFQGLVEKYQKLQTEIENELSTKFPKLDKEESIEIKYKDQIGQSMTLNTTFSWKDLIIKDWDREEQAFRSRAKSEQNTTNQIFFTTQADFRKKCSEKREEIYSKYPDLRNYQNIIDNAVKKIGYSEQLAFNIATAERKVYQKLYEKESMKSSSNACKDFVL